MAHFHGMRVEADPRCRACDKNLETAPDAVWCETALGHPEEDPLCEACCSWSDAACEHCADPLFISVAATPLPAAAGTTQRPGRGLSQDHNPTGSFPLHVIGVPLVRCALCPNDFAEDHTYPILNVGPVCGGCIEAGRLAS